LATTVGEGKPSKRVLAKKKTPARKSVAKNKPAKKVVRGATKK